MIETLQGHGVSLNRRWVLCDLVIKEKIIVFNTEKNAFTMKPLKVELEEENVGIVPHRFIHVQ